MTSLHTPSLLLALAVSSAIMAGASWLAFVKTARISLRWWAGGMMLQSAAAMVLFAAHRSSGNAYLVAGGALLAYSYSLKACAVSVFLQRTTPLWALYGLPLAAVAALVAWLQSAPASASLRAASGAWTLALLGFTIALSFAFILGHQARAHGLATTDPLTGLYNRRMFKELANAELSRARRDLTSVSVLAFDLDWFKRVNDTYGHVTGDRVLAAFAALLRGTLRQEDIVARYGGEEFVALLPGTPQAAAAALAERIRGALAQRAMKVARHEFQITVSAGVATGQGRQLPSLEGLLDLADLALYAAKARGRDRVAVHDASVIALTPHSGTVRQTSDVPAPVRMQAGVFRAGIDPNATTGDIAGMRS